MSASMPPNCAALARYTELNPKSNAPPRPRGRPKTRTADHYAELLHAHQALCKWFEEAKGRPPTSDLELLTAFFSTNFQQRSQRASRIDSREVQAKLKTLRNELSQARQLAAICPEKTAITGTH